MLTSMTGFGRAVTVLPSAGRAVVEIQTLNHRFLEVECRLPEGFMSLEQPVRALVAKSVKRGRVRVYVNVKTRHSAPAAALREDLAKRYAQELRQLQKKLKLSGEVTLSAVLGMPNVIAPPLWDDSLEKLKQPVEKAATQALNALIAMRRKEGIQLTKTLEGIERNLQNLYKKISVHVPLVQKSLSQRLHDRLRAEVPAADPTLLVKEVAMLVRETDVAEEIARIGAHLVALRRAVDGQADSPGRTMDFLAQELQREVNTLGVKIRDGAVSRSVVEMKGLIEKLREQAANVE